MHQWELVASSRLLLFLSGLGLLELHLPTLQCKFSPFSLTRPTAAPGSGPRIRVTINNCKASDCRGLPFGPGALLKRSLHRHFNQGAPSHLPKVTESRLSIRPQPQRSIQCFGAWHPLAPLSPCLSKLRLWQPGLRGRVGVSHQARRGPWGVQPQLRPVSWCVTGPFRQGSLSLSRLSPQRSLWPCGFCSPSWCRFGERLPISTALEFKKLTLLGTLLTWSM